MEKTLSFKRIMLMTAAAALLCQLGAALTCLPSGSVMHMPTVKSTALVAVIAFVMAVIIEAVLTWVVDYGKHAAFWLLIAAVFLLLVSALSFAHPVKSNDGGLAFRYPTLAVMGFAEMLTVLLTEKTRPVFGLPAVDTREPGFVFLAAVTVIGIALCIILPHETHLNYDDESHYKDSIIYSQGIYVATNNADTRMFYWFWDHDNGISKADREENDAALIKGDNDGSLYLDPKIRAYNLRNIGYLGTVAGIWLGNALGLNAPARITVARIGCLLVYTAVMSLAIKRLKSGKILLFLLGISPYAVYSAVCFNYDAWMLAFVSLGLAYFFGAFQRPDDKLSDGELFIMTAALTLGCIPKAPYAVALLVLLLLPKEKFVTDRQRKRFYLQLAVVIALLLAYTVATSFGIGDPVDDRGGYEGEVSGYKQLVFVLSNLPGYFAMLFRFLFGGYLLSQSYLSSFVYLGSTGAYTVVLVAIAAAALTEGGCSIQSVPARICGVTVLLLTIMSAATAMYLVFTPVGMNTVMGCQTRYTIHLIFPLFMFCFNGWLNLKVPKRIYNMVFYLTGIGVLLFNIIELVVIPSLC